MEYLNSGKSKEQVLEKVWGCKFTDDMDYVRIYISHLRQKIEPDNSSPRYIMTEPGVGYYFQKASWYQNIPAEPAEGFEPTTCALRKRCSSNWATLAIPKYSIILGDRWTDRLIPLVTWYPFGTT